MFKEQNIEGEPCLAGEWDVALMFDPEAGTENNKLGNQKQIREVLELGTITRGKTACLANSRQLEVEENIFSQEVDKYNIYALIWKGMEYRKESSTLWSDYVRSPITKLERKLH